MGSEMCIRDSPVVCEALLAIRALEDGSDDECDGHKPSEVIAKINDERKANKNNKELKSSAFSNNIKPLKKYKLLDPTNSSLKLTTMGIYLSGFLKVNENELNYEEM